MKYFSSLLCLLISVIIYSQTVSKTKIYLIGVVHDSSLILKPQMLYKILDSIKPEILLQENDRKQIAEYTKVIRPESKWRKNFLP